jgi:ribosome-associated protein
VTGKRCNNARVTTIPRRKQAQGTSSLDLSRRLLAMVEKSLDGDKAEDIVVIDLHGKSSMADFMVIASGRSQRQLHAMAEHLQAKLREQGAEDVGIEGARVGDWVLIDGGDVVVHLFKPEVRRFYNLEKMWGIVLPTPERLAAMA